MNKTIKLSLVVTASLVFLAAAAHFYLSHRGLIASETAPLPSCPSMLKPDVERLVRPVLVASTRSDWGPDYAALEQLLHSKEPAALEARVALMAYYIGEHPGEELLESVMSAGPAAVPLVKQYSQCRPRLRSEREIGTVLALRTLYNIYSTETSRNVGKRTSVPSIH